MLGVGIALGNVLLPALVKRDFAERQGPMTALYSSAMGPGAAVAAGVSVPLASAIGWRGSLGLWAALAVLALVVWLPQLRRSAPPRRRGTVLDSLRVLGRSRLAWAVALFMGLQSLTFYVVLAWLPDLLQGRGLAPEAAGWMLALSQAAGIAGSAAVPLWAGRLRDQRRIVWALAAVEAVAIGGLLAPVVGLESLWVSLLGFVLGGSFGLSLLFLAIRADTPETAAALSGMAQSVGYLVAAVGPFAFGAIHDLSGGWTLPLLSLAVVLVAKVTAGLPAARNEQLFPLPTALMNTRIKTGFVAGALGALVLVALFYAQWAAGLGGVPGFVGNYQATFGTRGASDHVLGVLLFAASGGVWGAIYGALVSPLGRLEGDGLRRAPDAVVLDGRRARDRQAALPGRRPQGPRPLALLQRRGVGRLPGMVLRPASHLASHLDARDVTSPPQLRRRASTTTSLLHSITRPPLRCSSSAFSPALARRSSPARSRTSRRCLTRAPRCSPPRRLASWTTNRCASTSPALDARVNDGEQAVRRAVLEHIVAAPQDETSFSLLLVSVVQDAERCGDLAKTLAKVSELADHPRMGHHAETLSAIRDRVQAAFPRARRAFVDGDADEARALMDEHARTKAEVASLIAALTSDPELSPNASAVLAMGARIIGRTSSHLSNVISAVALPFDQVRGAPTWSAS